ncbi:MAG: DUF4268 domain-containing protein [Burkholderiaceae bacterium]
MNEIGKLEEVPLRELWSHEEFGFSAWLEENLDALGAAVSVALSDPRREVPVGAFSVDLVAEDEDGARVVVENQLSATDHDHLGKLLTYLTNLDAKTAIWICRPPRPEHIRAIQWLNETTPEDIAFYLVRLAAYRIGDSPPAPLFTVIVAPSAESKDFGKSKKLLAERHVIRLRFWEQLLKLARDRGLSLHAQRSPTKDHWLGAGAGIRSGVSYNYLAWMEDGVGVELYIDTGDAAENKQLFDAFHAKKDQIEHDFGAPLLWERLDTKRASRIKYLIPCGGLTSEEQWPEIQEKLVDAMRRFSDAMRRSGVR